MKRTREQKFIKESWITIYGIPAVVALIVILSLLGGLKVMLGAIAGLIIGSLLVWRAKQIETLGAKGLTLMGKADTALTKVRKLATHPSLEGTEEVTKTVNKAQLARETLFDACINLQRESRSGRYLERDINMRWDRLMPQAEALEALAVVLEDLKDERRAHTSVYRMPTYVETAASAAVADINVLASSFKAEILDKRNERKAYEANNPAKALITEEDIERREKLEKKANETSNADTIVVNVDGKQQERVLDETQTLHVNESLTEHAFEEKVHHGETFNESVNESENHYPIVNENLVDETHHDETPHDETLQEATSDEGVSSESVTNHDNFDEGLKEEVLANETPLSYLNSQDNNPVERNTDSTEILEREDDVFEESNETSSVSSRDESRENALVEEETKQSETLAHEITPVTQELNISSNEPVFDDGSSLFSSNEPEAQKVKPAPRRRNRRCKN